MSETPPFEPGAAPGKKGISPLIWVALAFVVLCCGGGGVMIWLGMRGVKEVGPLMGCGMTLGALASALEDYAADNEGRLPSPANWEEELRPYYSLVVGRITDFDNPLIDLKPADASGPWGCRDASGSLATGIAMNSDLVDTPYDEISGNTVVFFEVASVGTNLTEAFSPRELASSPKLMGQPRGWGQVTKDGTVGGFREEFIADEKAFDVRTYRDASSRTGADTNAGDPDEGETGDGSQ